MLESYVMKKFLERVNVLKFGYCLSLDEMYEKSKGFNKNKLIIFLNHVCNNQFRDNLTFKLMRLESDFNGKFKAYFNVLLNGVNIPLLVNFKDFSMFSKKDIPYRLCLDETMF